MSNQNPDNEPLYFNGVNGATGGYLFEPQTIAQISDIAQESIVAEQLDGGTAEEPSLDSHLSALRKRDRRSPENDDEKTLGPIEGVDPKNLGEAGWGIIFPENIDPEIEKALHPLIEHRRQTSGKYFREYRISPGTSVGDFLSEWGANIADPANPANVPYYLLIVGDFQAIPFDFQYQLDVQYAVGRIYFQNTTDYEQYANSVVEAETTNLSLPCRVNLFGTRNPDDRATQLSADRLVQPLAEFFRSDPIFQKNNAHWQIETHLEKQATKAQLSQLLGGKDTPALLFTASHGVGFPKNHHLQLRHQGAIVCQDWPGPRNCPAPLPEDYYFSADDISESHHLLGLISFHFACYGAGTPQIDQFGHQRNSWPEIAPYAFVANLPQRLLSHPNGGALAFVSHVDRAWGNSYSWAGKENIGSFHSVLQRLIEGHPIGSAIEFINERYAAISTELTKELWYIHATGRTANNSALSYLWTANNDARSYMIIGDPAVRLAVRNDTQKTETSTLNLSQKNQPEITENNRSEFVEVLDKLIAEVQQNKQKTDLCDRLIQLLETLRDRTQQLEKEQTPEAALASLQELLDRLISNLD